jgi:hypothetical protein
LIIRHKKEENDIIEEYKLFIDDLLLDISDDYNVEFLGGKFNHHEVDNDDNFLDYRISFESEKNDEFFEKLEEVLNRMVDAGISYTIKSINTYENVNGTIFANQINTESKYKIHPYCIIHSKNIIRRLNHDKYCLYISF